MNRIRQSGQVCSLKYANHLDVGFLSFEIQAVYIHTDHLYLICCYFPVLWVLSTFVFCTINDFSKLKLCICHFKSF